MVREANVRSRNTVAEVIALADSFEGGTGPQIDSAILEAENILKGIKQLSLAPLIDKANYELENVSSIIFW